MENVEKLLYSPFLANLEKYIGEVLRTKDRALISVVGKNGTGKSYFGRYVRKNGIGRYDKKAVLVIDDRVVTLRFLCFFKRKIKIPRNGVDNLNPFLGKLPEEVKIILYINNTPADKIESADILLQLITDEETRRKRLQQRYGKEPEKLKRYLDKDEIEDYGIKYTYMIEAKV